MNPSEAISIVSICIAGLALVQSWRAGRKASKTTRETNDLIKQLVVVQDRLTQIEQSREDAKRMQSLQAVIHAELRKTDRSSWRLFVVNTGQGTARNVAITLDGKPLLEHDAVPRGEQETKMIGPKSEISYCMAICRGCCPPFELDATWDDDSGQQGRYGTTLTF
ncbi:MAG: hypothetical protein KAV00_16935 [Phycisphaerae bacterium]|nr:hypothetical protein [Phycisphaerae bacterium]